MTLIPKIKKLKKIYAIKIKIRNVKYLFIDIIYLFLNRTDLKKISRDGLFEWSYVGNEPAQLALAILASHLNDEASALQLYPVFMRAVVANFDNEWEMHSSDIDKALANISKI